MSSVRDPQGQREQMRAAPETVTPGPAGIVIPPGWEYTTLPGPSERLVQYVKRAAKAYLEEPK